MVALLVGAMPAAAFEFDAQGAKGRFDTTITAGALFRVQDRDPEIIARANGGLFNTHNADDGNLNYDRGLVSLASRATHELSLTYQDIGFFGRFTYFYDAVNADPQGDFAARTGRRELPNETIDRIGYDFDLLDAFVYGNVDLGGIGIDYRIGQQVLSWGESTFIQNGINTINPIDVSALRVPGTELKESFLPVPIVDVTVTLSDRLSIEAFTQVFWRDTEPEAYGSFFSTTDVASPGAQGLILNFGNPTIPDISDPRGSVISAIQPFGSVVPRGPDQEPGDFGQYGFAVRYFSPELNDTEFGLYFINYHSRLPVLELQTGTAAQLASVLPPNPTNQFNTRFSEYRLVYPEDIKLYGFSWNTGLPFGVSFQGEYTYRQDQPLALDDVEVVHGTYSGIAAINLFLLQEQGARAQAAAFQRAGNTAAANAALTQAATFRGTATAITNAFATNYPLIAREGLQVNNPQSAIPILGRTIEGFDLFDMSQFQFTATKVFGPMFGASQWVLLGEVGGNYIHGFPEDGEPRLDGPGTERTFAPALQGGTPFGGGALPDAGVSQTGFATKFSWGYRLTARFDFLDAFAGVNLSPSLSVQHDVDGVTPGPISNFVEDRVATSVALRATFLDRFTADLSYSSFFGASSRNLVNDRDFVAVSFKYAF